VLWIGPRSGRLLDKAPAHGAKELGRLAKRSGASALPSMTLFLVAILVCAAGLLGPGYRHDRGYFNYAPRLRHDYGRGHYDDRRDFR
jgi:hypothetical protein